MITPYLKMPQGSGANTFAGLGKYRIYTLPAVTGWSVRQMMLNRDMSLDTLQIGLRIFPQRYMPGKV
jgi:hypothetical protein